MVSPESESRKLGPAPITGRITRALFALAAMTITWMFFVLYLLLSHYRVAGLSMWIGAVALVTYVCVALPLVTLFPPGIQQRFWYLLVFLGFVWDMFVMSLLFHETPLAILRTPYPGNVFPIWFAAFTLSSIGIYLFLLRRNTRTVAEPHS